MLYLPEHIKLRCQSSVVDRIGYSSEETVNRGGLTAGIVIIILCIAIITGCAKLDPETSGLPVEESLPDVELFDASITYTQAGQTQFQVHAPHISQFETTDLLLLQGGIEVDLFNELGQHTALLTAEEGEVLEREQRLLAHGNVVVRADSGMVLYADTLYYDPKARRVKSDGFVIIVTDLDSLSGYGFSASPNLKDWEIKNTSGATWREVEPR